jgi:hypothetical protein
MPWLLIIADIISIILSNLRPMDPEGENGRLARDRTCSQRFCVAKISWNLASTFYGIPCMPSALS